MIRVIYLFVSFMFILSCSHAAVKREGTDSTTRPGPRLSERVGEEAAEIRLPEIPATITDPEARAGFLLVHYWDLLDFADTRLSRDTAFMEQSFANFIGLFPHADGSVAGQAMSAMVRRASVSREASVFLMEIAEKYLADPNSPMRDEELFISYSDALGASGLSGTETARVTYLAGQFAKNRPGEAARDFGFTLRDGSHGTLRGFASQVPEMLILLFYDPDCGSCAEILGMLSSSRGLEGVLASGRTRLLAVYPGDDAGLWRENAPELPASWSVAHASSELEEEGLYYLPALPSLYLVAPDGTVVARDLPADRLMEMVE